MATKNLTEFYETKYLDEADADYKLREVCVGPVISGRFEAAVVELPKYLRGGDILEIGAGRGEVAYTLLRSDTPIDTYTITDLSRNRVMHLKERLADGRVHAEIMDVDSLDTESYGRAYDAVIIIALIEHLIDPITVMANLRKIIRPGGFIYIDTPNVAKYTQRLKLLAGRFPSTASRDEGFTTFDGKPVALHDEGHLHYFTFRSLEKMLTERCGFARVEKIGYPGGRQILGGRVHMRLARMWPELFSELALIAFVD